LAATKKGRDQDKAEQREGDWMSELVARHSATGFARLRKGERRMRMRVSSRKGRRGGQERAAKLSNEEISNANHFLPIPTIIWLVDRINNMSNDQRITPVIASSTRIHSNQLSFDSKDDCSHRIILPHRKFENVLMQQHTSASHSLKKKKKKKPLPPSEIKLVKSAVKPPLAKPSSRLVSRTIVPLGFYDNTDRLPREKFQINQPNTTNYAFNLLKPPPSLGVADLFKPERAFPLRPNDFRDFLVECINCDEINDKMATVRKNSLNSMQFLIDVHNFKLTAQQTISQKQHSIKGRKYKAPENDNPPETDEHRIDIDSTTNHTQDTLDLPKKSLTISYNSSDMPSSQDSSGPSSPTSIPESLARSLHTIFDSYMQESANNFSNSASGHDNINTINVPDAIKQEIKQSIDTKQYKLDLEQLPNIFDTAAASVTTELERSKHLDNYIKQQSKNLNQQEIKFRRISGVVVLLLSLTVFLALLFTVNSRYYRLVTLPLTFWAFGAYLSGSCGICHMLASKKLRMDKKSNWISTLRGKGNAIIIEDEAILSRIKQAVTKMGIKTIILSLALTAVMTAIPSLATP
jgi:hypothetical protein